MTFYYSTWAIDRKKKVWEVFQMRKGRLKEKAAQSTAFQWRKFAFWNKSSRRKSGKTETQEYSLIQRFAISVLWGHLSYSPSCCYKIPNKDNFKKSLFGLTVPENMSPQGREAMEARTGGSFSLCVHSQEAELGLLLTLGTQPAFSLTQPEVPVSGNISPHLGWLFPT